MREFKRTWEKVIAWIANVIMLLSTALVAFFAYTSGFSGYLDITNSRAEFEMALQESISNNPALVGQNIPPVEELLVILDGVFKAYVIFLLVLTIVAIVATLLMKKRVLAGVIFIIIALLSVLLTFTILWFVSLAYLIVAIMLFVRKEPKNFDPFNPNNPQNRVDKIEYV